MPELTIEAVGRLEAGEILSSPSRCVEVTYILSIGDPFDELPLGYSNVPDKLRLLIADVVTELGATDEDVWQIIRLADTLRAATGTVLIVFLPALSVSPETVRRDRTGRDDGCCERSLTKDDE